MGGIFGYGTLKGKLSLELAVYVTLTSFRELWDF